MTLAATGRSMSKMPLAKKVIYYFQAVKIKIFCFSSKLFIINKKNELMIPKFPPSKSFLYTIFFGSKSFDHIISTPKIQD